MHEYRCPPTTSSLTTTSIPRHQTKAVHRGLVQGYARKGAVKPCTAPSRTVTPRHRYPLPCRHLNYPILVTPTTKTLTFADELNHNCLDNHAADSLLVKSINNAKDLSVPGTGCFAPNMSRSNTALLREQDVDQEVGLWVEVLADWDQHFSQEWE
jgi:hypothetical protein